MLFFHLRYRKLTSNIENSNHSFEKQKKPPGDFSSLNTTAYPHPLYNSNSLLKNQKNSQLQKNKKAFTQRWIQQN